MPFKCELVVTIPNFDDDWMHAHLDGRGFENIGAIIKEYSFDVVPNIGWIIRVPDKMVRAAEIRVRDVAVNMEEDSPHHYSIYGKFDLHKRERTEEEWAKLLIEHYDNGWR